MTKKWLGWTLVGCFLSSWSVADIAIVDPLSTTGFHWLAYVSNDAKPEFLEMRFCREMLETPTRDCASNHDEDLIIEISRFRALFNAASLDSDPTYQAAKRSMNQASSLVGQAKYKVVGLEKEIETLRSRSAVLTATVARLEKKLQDPEIPEEDKAQIRKDLAIARVELNAIPGKIQAKESDLTAVKGTLPGLEADFEDKKALFARREEYLKSLRDRFYASLSSEQPMTLDPAEFLHGVFMKLMEKNPDFGGSAFRTGGGKGEPYKISWSMKGLHRATEGIRVVLICNAGTSSQSFPEKRFKIDARKEKGSVSKSNSENCSVYSADVSLQSMNKSMAISAPHG